MSHPEIQTIMSELAKMREEQTTIHMQLQTSITELSGKTDEMYRAFNAGSIVVSFLKILGIIAIAISGFLLTIKQLH